MTIQVEILQFLHYNPSSSRAEIAEALTNAPNERTLKRIIAECVQKGDIVVEGKGKATRYSLSAQAHLMMPLDLLYLQFPLVLQNLSAPELLTYFQLF